MTYKDKGSYESSPPCIIHLYNVCCIMNLYLYGVCLVYFLCVAGHISYKIIMLPVTYRKYTIHISHVCCIMNHVCCIMNHVYCIMNLYLYGVCMAYSLSVADYISYKIIMLAVTYRKYTIHISHVCCIMNHVCCIMNCMIYVTYILNLYELCSVC